MTVKVNTLPTVSLTAPLAGANFIAPATISLTSDPVATGAGNTISKVEYFEGSNLVATANAAPFSASWNNVIAGSYSLTAKATDSNNNSITSSPVAITVINNTAPTVSFTANPSNATAPATIVINATAADTDGTIAKVELFNGETNIATMEAPPFNFLWENVAAGSYVLKAKATDNLGATKTSSDIPVNVTAAVPVLYDIHVDHLGTPRMVTDGAGNSVWEWIGTPFGESLPNQNPSGVAGKEFVMNLRFPGQVFDQETGLHYNYFRDYDPSTGRYVQSDPIGLNGGINTFTYVSGQPVTLTDSLGLCAGGACTAPSIGGRGTGTINSVASAAWRAATTAVTGVSVTAVGAATVAGYAGWRAGSWFNNKYEQEIGDIADSWFRDPQPMQAVKAPSVGNATMATLLKFAKECGWTCTMGGNGHYKCYGPNGQGYTTIGHDPAKGTVRGIINAIKKNCVSKKCER